LDSAKQNFQIPLIKSKWHNMFKLDCAQRKPLPRPKCPPKLMRESNPDAFWIAPKM